MPKKRGHNVSSVSLGSAVSNENAETCTISVDPPFKRRTRSSSLKANGFKISSGQEPLNKCSNADQSSDFDSNGASSPQQRQSIMQKTLYTSPRKSKSPHACASGGYNGDLNGQEEKFDLESPNLRGRRLDDICCQNMKWNPKDSSQMHALKEALHAGMEPSSVICREEEQRRVFEFCKGCIEQEKAGSLYVCGCPGTGKTLSIGKVNDQLMTWADDAGYQRPNMLVLNCTSLVQTSAIFNKIVECCDPHSKLSTFSSPLHYLKESFSEHTNFMKMMLLIIDEIDYLITKDRSVLHELFMLTSLPFSRLILIGIANAIDLADRFLPKLQALNCKPMVVTFRPYSKDQILCVLQERMCKIIGAFDPQALELCSRRVAAASGDMRKALSVCRSAIDLLEAELTESNTHVSPSADPSSVHAMGSSIEALHKQKSGIVRIDHIALALSKAFKSAIVDIIQSLPQHQQIVLCSAVKLFNHKKKDTTIGELNKSYVDICKSACIPPANMLEFSNMCRVLSDQGLFKLASSREDRLKRLTLKVDEADITFSLQGIRFFRNCLQ